MDQLLQTLQQLGLGLATNAVYDLIKHKFAKPNATIDKNQIESEIQNTINLNGVHVEAATVINVLAKDGFIKIEGSHLHGPDGLVLGGLKGRTEAGNNTQLTTDKSAIVAGVGASIKTQGNAQIRMGAGGDISICT